MRNPFIRGGAVPADRLAFIVATKGGSSWLLAGALFWAGAGVSGLLASSGVWTKVYLYGGFSVPIVGWLFAKAQSVTVPPKSALVPLVAIAATITPFCFPLLILIERRDPALLPVALTTIDGAHLLVLMWLQLDYAYFLAAVAKGIIGATFGSCFWSSPRSEWGSLQQPCRFWPGGASIATHAMSFSSTHPTTRRRRRYRRALPRKRWHLAAALARVLRAAHSRALDH